MKYVATAQRPLAFLARPVVSRLQLLCCGLLGAALVGCAQMPFAAKVGDATATSITTSTSPTSATSASLRSATAGTGSRSTYASGITTTTSYGTSSGTSTAAPPRPGDPPPLRPFAEIVRDATRTDGFIPVWRKDERLWLEIGEAQFGQPFMFHVNYAQSVGERGLHASQMGPAWMVEWRKLGNTVQLVALNTAFRAGTPGAPADPTRELLISQAFSNSLLASMQQAGAPHPQRKSILVDASFLMADIPSYGSKIESAFRIGYGLDRANSQFTASSADAEQTVIATKMHFATSRIPAPSSAPGAPSASPPGNVPDARSFFVGFVYSLARLSDKPMAVRLADPRIGHFSTSYTDVASDTRDNARIHMVNRWRLDKKDPAAAMSEPVKPITFWIDKNVPPKYRGAVQEGILEWNKAFEAIGFKNAIVASQQSATATFDTLDARHASVRWYVGSDASTAIGPSRTDPRTGEILDADIAMLDIFARTARRYVSETSPDAAAMTSEQRLAQILKSTSNAGMHADHSHFQGQCLYGAESAMEAAFAQDILEARGDIAPDSPEAEAFAQAAIKSIVIHEVGHTLGLKHNFKASTAISRAALRQPGAISGSVMDYNAYNVPLQGEKQAGFKGDLVQSGLGAYDYWAIAYAYSQFPAGTEPAELAKIAARNTEPALAYGDDADAGFGSEGADPDANRYDAGDDPLAFYQRRFKLSQELWARLQARGLRGGDAPDRARRGLNVGFGQLGAAVELVGKYIGGMRVVRDLPGTTERRTFTPVEPAKQREALDFMTQALFDVKSFEFAPEFLNGLSMDFNEWRRDGPYSVPSRVLGLQSTALDKLLSAGTAQRLLELPNFVPAQGTRNAIKPLISLQEVYTTLQSAVWTELAGTDISPMRRNLQREHLKRVTAALTRPSNLPADALSLMRYNAQALQRQLSAASAKSASQSVETRAHLADSLGLLTEALRATMQRAG